jgi:hypothetical protein
LLKQQGVDVKGAAKSSTTVNEEVPPLLEGGGKLEVVLINVLLYEFVLINVLLYEFVLINVLLYEFVFLKTTIQQILFLSCPYTKNNFITQVWCVDGNAKTAVPKEDIGKFYSGDCYIILYMYHSGDKREEYYLTYWIGKDSLAVIILCLLPLVC